MKTVIIVSLHNSNWGAERSTCSIADYLKSLGYQVILIIPSKGKIIDIINQYGLDYQVHYFRSWVNSKGTNYFRAIVSSIIDSFQLLSIFVKLKRANIKPDLVYSNTLVHCFGIRLSKIYSVPHLQHIRENIDVFGMKFNWGYKNSLDFINNNSKKIICTCTAIRDRYLDDFDNGKLAVVYNGIPVKPYSQPNFESDTFAMIYAGRLSADKRPEDIVKAINEIVFTGIKDIRLDIYGKGDLEDNLRAYVVNNRLENNIIFMGFQDSIDFSRYYLGFLPSEFEAFARTTLEYMMNGLAVIGTNTGGTKEQVLHNETGYLYSPGNVGDIKEYILDLYYNREKCLRYGISGYERVNDLFSQKKYVQNLSKYFIDYLD